jgi:hypothetical protein
MPKSPIKVFHAGMIKVEVYRTHERGTLYEFSAGKTYPLTVFPHELLGLRDLVDELLIDRIAHDLVRDERGRA